MKTVTTNPSTFEQLADIEKRFNETTAQKNDADKKDAPYHEYHRIQQDRGFVKITLPKKGLRG